MPRSYGLKGASRGTPNLTWSFSGTVTGVKTPTVQIAQAFNTWQAAAPALRFTQVNANADITIGLGKLGAVPGGVALASTSSDGRSITISNSASFVPSGAATDFLNVITHEIGHSLGLLHDTTTSSIMYPFTSTQEALGSDDIASIRALYSWSPQVKLQGGTEQVPAICACGDALVMAWRGSGNDHTIWTALSADGVNWTPQKTIPGAATIGSPALAWDGRQAWLVWRGSGDDNLYWSTSNDLFQRSNSGVHRIDGSGSSHGPRIAIVGGRPTMVWKGVNDDHNIYMSSFNNGWSGQTKFGNVGTTSAPAICPDLRGGARVVWKGTGNDSTLWNAQLSGTSLSPQTPVKWTVLGNGSSAGTTGSPGSTEGPGLTLARSRILMTWRGVNGDDGLYFTQLALDTLPNGTTAEQWSSQAKIPNTGGSLGVSVAEYKGVVHAVWKGIPNDTGIYSATI